MSGLTRYTVRADCSWLLPYEQGEWVKADEAEAAIEAERARIVELIEAWRHKPDLGVDDLLELVARFREGEA